MVDNRKVVNKKKWSPENARAVVVAFVDDFILASRDVEAHCALLVCFGDALKEAGLVTQKSKLELFMRRWSVLGFLMEGGTIRPDPKRTV